MSYGRLFYRSRRKWVVRAANAMMPTLIGISRIRSIADVGCGTGLWVAAAQRHGLEAVGIDGPWVNRNDLEIPHEHFLSANLLDDWKLDRSVDMAISLEVAEHLAPESARRFVQKLTNIAPLIVFSAAIPGQGGQSHVNEQWPSYWIRMFKEVDYKLFDILRPRIWNDRRIPYWCRQNTLVFASPRHPDLLASLERKRADGDFGGADLVHPNHAMRALQYPGLGALARALPFAFIRTLASVPSWRAPMRIARSSRPKLTPSLRTSSNP